MLIKHKEDFLSINGVQSVNVEDGIIEFENYFKQLPASFKIYADFECNLRDVEIYESSYTKNIMIMFLVVLLIKLFVLTINLVNRLLLIEAKMLLMNLLKQLLKNISTAKKIMKKYFNKNLIMSKEEYLFQQSNSCWICKKLINHDDEKVRDH